MSDPLPPNIPPPNIPPPNIPPPNIPPPDLPPPVRIDPPMPSRASLAPEPPKDPLLGAAEDSGLAPFNKRFLAGLIDLLVAAGLQWALVGVLPILGWRFAWLVAAAYLVLRDSLPFLGGQSVGKTAMKLRVLTQDGQSLVRRWEAAVIRNGVLLIPLFAMIEVIVLLLREDKADQGRRLGDVWAKTKVIEIPPAESPQD